MKLTVWSVKRTFVGSALLRILAVKGQSRANHKISLPYPTGAADTAAFMVLC